MTFCKTFRLRSSIQCLLAAAVVAASSTLSRAADPDAVDAAIAKGVEFLFNDSTFKQYGNWETEQKSKDTRNGDSITGPQWGGRTALCTYAILASGVSPNDARLKKPIEF